MSSFLKILPNVFSLSLTSFHPAFRNPFTFVLDISSGPADHIVLERHLHSTDLSAHKLGMAPDQREYVVRESAVSPVESDVLVVCDEVR